MHMAVWGGVDVCGVMDVCRCLDDCVWRLVVLGGLWVCGYLLRVDVYMGVCGVWMFVEG